MSINQDHIGDANKMVSSIEWLIDNLYLKDSLKWEEILEQAKAMHKEEIMEAHYAPQYGCFSKDYYNETFGGEE